MKLPTKLFHYSKDKITNLKDDFDDDLKLNCPEEGSSKPIGLWVSVEENEDDINWFTWCVGEDFFIDNLKHKYSVILSKDCKILHLKTTDEIHEFSFEYSENSFINNKNPPYPHIFHINWSKVKEKYDGIIISPYQWDARLRSASSWYYGWDCSSGCIWNYKKINLKLNSIIDVEAIKPKAFPPEESSTDSLLASLVLSA